MVSALEAFGASKDDIEKAVEREKQNEFDLWEENESALNLFVAMKTQWRVGGIKGSVIGLDYNVLPMVMDFIGIEKNDRPASFFGLQAAEDEAIKFLSDA